MINSLRKAPGKKIFGVVGIAHLDGIVKYWENMEERVKELGMEKKDLE